MRYLVLRPSPDDAVAAAFETELTRREGAGSSTPTGAKTSAPTLDVREVVDQNPRTPRERTICYATAAHAKAIAASLNATWAEVKADG